MDIFHHEGGDRGQEVNIMGGFRPQPEEEETFQDKSSEKFLIKGGNHVRENFSFLLLQKITYIFHLVSLVILGMNINF